MRFLNAIALCLVACGGADGRASIDGAQGASDGVHAPPTGNDAAVACAVDVDYAITHPGGAQTLVTGWTAELDIGADSEGAPEVQATLCDYEYFGSTTASGVIACPSGATCTGDITPRHSPECNVVDAFQLAGPIAIVACGSRIESRDAAGATIGLSGQRAGFVRIRVR